MKRSEPNLEVSLPRCRCCGSYWRPALGVNANAAYCKRCVKQRRATAASAFGLKHITPADLTGNFLLPRRMRRT